MLQFALRSLLSFRRPMALSPVNVGELIAGKYLVESVIGEGGMGIVVAARHLELEQRVAIKFLLPAIAEQELAAQRFRREARAAARIRGEHVCRVLDVGSLEQGVPYMVMEYLDGCDLAAELMRRGRLPVEEVVDYVLQACEALAEAHSAGIVHRDLKPGNLFLAAAADGTRRIKVLDFGVSKFLIESASGSPALTKTSSLIGSPIYMAPEQFDGSKRVDERTDIWALGIVMYELCTGATPFEAETIAQLISGVLHSKPLPFSHHNLIVPEGFEELVERALSKQPQDRFASVSELATALVPYGPMHASLRASRVSRLLPSATPGQRMSHRPPTPVPSRASNRTPANASLDEQQPASNSRAPTPSAWEMTEKPARFRYRRLGVALVALLAPLFGALVYRQLRTPDPSAEASANRTVATAPQTSVGALQVAPERAVSPTPEPAPVHSPVAAAVPSATVPLAAAAVPAANKAPSVWPTRPRGPLKPVESAAAPASARPAQAPALSDFGGRR
jgi:serine/threonine protein kinase